MCRLARVNIKFNLKPHQIEAMNAARRFDVRVWSRRSGKTFAVLAQSVKRCIEAKTKDHRSYYIAPTRVQAKAVAWDYLIAWLGDVPGISFNLAELRIDFPNGSRLQLLGGEQYDALRGRYADEIIIDETAHIPSAAWTQVLSPMIADRKGRVTFIGTPNGRMSLFWDVYDYAQKGTDPEWSHSTLDVYQAGMLDAHEIKRMKAQLSEPEFNQELLCSWDAALYGSYYAPQMAKVAAAGRITTVAYDESLPVYCAVDLGWSDGMACIWAQPVGTEMRIIKALEYQQTSIAELVAAWRKLPFTIDTVILPHDARVHDLGTGKVRQEVFHDLGCSTTICAKIGLDEGIDQVRRMLGNAWFDEHECKFLLEALNSYRSSYDEVRGVHSLKPIHNWASHMADCMRYLAVGKPSGSGWGDRPKAKLGTYA